MREDFAQTGLSEMEAAAREAAGQVNTRVEAPTKTVGQIICSHVFTLFNLLNLLLAALVVAVGSYRNMLFMGVVLSNMVIGIYQELRAKRTIDRLTILTEPRVQVLRDGETRPLPVERLVLGDLILLEAGAQIPADAAVLDGECEVNEALLTGEPDAILKRAGDSLKSGSFLVSGHCRAVVEHVGADNYAARLTQQAKTLKKPRSQLMDAVNTIIRIVSFLIVPMAVLMFCKQYLGLSRTFQEAVVATVSSAVGMIPEGLVLLTSVSLAVGILKLASRRTLVQEMYSIESLARVDVLCLDKTGTITQGSMKLEKLELLGNASLPETEAALAALLHGLADRNPTADALREAYPTPPDWTLAETVPFSSARKYSAASFAAENNGRQGYALGAPEFLLNDREQSLSDRIRRYADSGKRVLVFCTARIEDGCAHDAVPQAIVVLSDRVRPDAKATFDYFKSQGVTLKIISGDAHTTVASVAREAGLEVKASCDLEGMSDEQVASVCEDYTVFGRVSPSQKCVLVDALKHRGHTVAMTGDGVNDVLALKSADCSIAMAAGSDAARHVSQLVLLDSNFASLPQVVAEGRRVVNNMRRASSLYLVKTVYSALLSLIFLFLNTAWPFAPIQMTLIGAVTVGLPSFFLALEANDERVRSDFLTYVFTHALPGALSIVCGVLGLLLTSRFLPMSEGELSTLCAFTTGFVGFVVLFGVCLPFKRTRVLLFGGMFAAFLICVVFLGGLFLFTSLPPVLIPVLVAACAAVTVLVWLFTRLLSRLSDKRHTQR